MIYAGYKKRPQGDEQYTPHHAVLPIIKYLPRNAVVWCPFDTENSEFVLALKEAGYKVEYSHIFTGQDFFEYEPQRWDIISSHREEQSTPQPSSFKIFRIWGLGVAFTAKNS